MVLCVYFITSVTSEDSLSHQFLSEKSSMDILSDGEGVNQAVFLDAFLSNLTPRIREAIQTIPAADKQEDLQLFARYVLPLYNSCQI